MFDSVLSAPVQTCSGTSWHHFIVGAEDHILLHSWLIFSAPTNAWLGTFGTRPNWFRHQLTPLYCWCQRSWCLTIVSRYSRHPSKLVPAPADTTLLLVPKIIMLDLCVSVLSAPVKTGSGTSWHHIVVGAEDHILVHSWLIFSVPSNTWLGTFSTSPNLFRHQLTPLNCWCRRP